MNCSFVGEPDHCEKSEVSRAFFHNWQSQCRNDLQFLILWRRTIVKTGLVQSWVTLRKSLGNRLGYSKSSLFATIGRSEPSIPVQRGRAVQGPYCYQKAGIFEPCRFSQGSV